MAKNKITDLRDGLFDALRKIRDADDATLDKEIKKGTAIHKISQTIINSSKLEIEFLKTTKGQGMNSALVTDFLGSGKALDEAVDMESEKTAQVKKSIILDLADEFLNSSVSLEQMWDEVHDFCIDHSIPDATVLFKLIQDHLKIDTTADPKSQPLYKLHP